MMVALVALFIALSGGAYAGVALNQVRSANIKNGEVKTVDLANSAVTRAKVKNNAINSAKVLNGGLEAVDLSTAARTALRGAAGAAGAAGPTGPAGAAGASAGFASRTSNVLAFIANTDQTVATLALPAGNYVINAKLVANNNDAAVRQYGCSLRLDATVIDNFFDALELDVGDGTTVVDDRDVVSLTSAGTLAAAGTASVVCQTNSVSGNWLARTITAVQVASLTGP